MADVPLDALLAAVPLPCVAINQAERIVAINQSATALFGKATMGRHFITALRQPALAEAVEHCLIDDKPRSAAYLSGDAETPVTYEVHVRRLTAGGGVLLCFQDVTQLEQAGQMRRDFVANVSHELRTPLTSLMGFIDTLRGPAREDAAARARFLGIMAEEAERMNRLVGDLLSLSRVEADERVRPTQRVDLAEVLATTLRNLNPLAVDANVTVVPEIGDSPFHVLGDRDQLVQVFTNLIENAIKYGGAGKRVDVSAVLKERDLSLRVPAAQITVTDYGAGIDPRHLPRLTERFYRADNHRSRALGGTGLGLAIVKHILNRHRGRLKITSQPGQGAQFSVVLPLVGAPTST